MSIRKGSRKSNISVQENLVGRKTVVGGKNRGCCAKCHRGSTSKDFVRGGVSKVQLVSRNSVGGEEVTWGGKNVRAIPLKKQGGQENLRDPLGQNWDFLTPGQKRVISLHPRTQNSFFLLLSDMFFSFDPPDSFVQFYPPQTFFPADLNLLGQFFVNFIPLGQLFFTHFTSSDSLFC